MLVSGLIVTCGRGPTVMTATSLPVQPLLSVPVIVKVVDCVGVIVIDEPLMLPGCQIYVAAPVAVIVRVLPSQSAVLLGEAMTTGTGLTVIVMSAVALQPRLSATTTVYVVVEVGEAIGSAMLGLLSPEGGDHDQLTASIEVARS
jgi:hypothetical protein